MQTVETLNEGLKRGYRLTIPAGDIAARVDAEVRQVAPTIRMPGFRPGKVPANLIRKMHGPALEQQALDRAVQEGVQWLLQEQALRPATQPSIELGDYAAGQDAELSVSLEVLPQVQAPQIEGLTLERLTVEPTPEEIDEQVRAIAGQQKSFEDALEGHPAVEGDLVTLDFKGMVEGEAFEGGTGSGMAVELGSGRLIPGFEAQLEGITAGESRSLEVTFPGDYNVAYLKGKPATFAVTATRIQTPKSAGTDDELAKSLGLESLEQLRGLVRGQVEQELNGLTRTHMKRKLLDQLAANHDFEVPPSMVDAEFEQIWRQLDHEAGHEDDPVKARAEMETERDDYRRIAERRVRLGLLLSEIGQQHGVEVSGQEMQRLIMQAAQQYNPKDRERFVEYVRQDAMAAAQLRAPLYEDKVVDFLFAKAEISDRSVARGELEAAIEADEDGHAGGHVHGPGCGHDDHDHVAEVQAGAAPSVEAAEPNAKKPRKARSAEAQDESSAAAESAPEDAGTKPARKKVAGKGAPEEAEPVPGEDRAEPAPKKPRKKAVAEG